MYDLVIDAGHGGVDPGAVKGNRQEKYWTLRISKYQFKRFKELGVSVSLTRQGDETLSEDKRVSLAKQGRYCISNHLNAGGGDRGEVIHSIYANGQLANAIKEALLQSGQNAVKVYFRKGSYGDYYYMHRRTGKTVTNIVEYCFIDNDKDFEHFESKWEDYAEAVVRAFCGHISHPYKPPEKIIKKNDIKVDRIPNKSSHTYRLAKYIDTENLELIQKLKKEGYLIIEKPK